MVPATLNLSIHKGITLGPIVITCKDSDGVVVSLAGWSVFADARLSPSRPVVFSLSPLITDAANGQITIKKTDEQTDLLPEGIYQWDLVLEHPDGSRLGPYLSGRITVCQLNTQP